jgi:hypothetical protein
LTNSDDCGRPENTVGSEATVGLGFAPGTLIIGQSTAGKCAVRLDISGSALYADGADLLLHLSMDTRDANSGDIRVEHPS